MAHTPNRNLPTPRVTPEQALAAVNPKLEVTRTKLAVIPTDSLREVLCYEFKGNFDDRNFLVYINAQNGREERILLLLETEDGILTM